MNLIGAFDDPNTAISKSSCKAPSIPTCNLPKLDSILGWCSTANDLD